jgi:hypothetical protein
MKICCKCKQSLPLENFGKRSLSKDGLSPACILCKRAYDNKHYKTSPTRKDKIKLSNYERRQERLTFLGNYLSCHPCVDCGETDIVVLDFDHVRGTKVGEVVLLLHTSTLEKTLKEIEKCEVRCSNCHRRVTAQRAGTWRALWT